MPMIATTIISSIRVNPSCSCRRCIVLLCCPRFAALSMPARALRFRALVCPSVAVRVYDLDLLALGVARRELERRVCRHWLAHDQRFHESLVFVGLRVRLLDDALDRCERDRVVKGSGARVDAHVIRLRTLASRECMDHSHFHSATSARLDKSSAANKKQAACHARGMAFRRGSGKVMSRRADRRRQFLPFRPGFVGSLCVTPSSEPGSSESSVALPPTAAVFVVTVCSVAKRGR